MSENEDPKPHERMYYRHTSTGDRGWLVRREGRDMIRMDRGAHEELREFKPTIWVRDNETRPLTVWSVAQVAFAADRQLCRAIGLHELAKKAWLDLSENKRREWMETGPKGPELEKRRKLYEAITDSLRELTG